jgi:hypothetical protein
MAAIGSKTALERIKTPEYGIRPDFSFKLHYRGNFVVNHLEDDRGTEPIVRVKSYEKQTSLLQKCEVYLEHVKDPFRVLIVTTTQERVWNMITALQRKLGEDYKHRFLFNYRGALRADPIGSWCNLLGESTGLHG